MGEKVKLDVPPIACPVCGQGMAAVFEEVRAGKVVQCSSGGVTDVSYTSRFRVCDHCETEFAGHDEMEHNASQVNALHAEFGPVNFPR